MGAGRFDRRNFLKAGAGAVVGGLLAWRFWPWRRDPRPLSTPADQTLQHRPDRLSMAAHRRLARRRVDQHGSAVRLKSHT